MKKKIIIADFDEFSDKNVKLGNSHYAECFANDGYDVLWFSPLWNMLTYIQNKDRYFNKKKLSTPYRHKVSKNIYELTSYTSKLYGNYFFANNPERVINGEKYIKPNIRETLEKVEFLEVDVLWISNIKQYWLTNVVKYKKLIYRMPDDASEFKIYPKSIVEIENKLLEKADVIFVTSKKLLDKMNSRGKQAYWLPNAADFEHFHGFTDEPEEYKNCERPKIVYIGAIGYWFDDNIIEELVKKLDVEVFIIGNSSKDISKLKSLDRVHVLGARSYDIIPNYLHYGDVAIIPFVRSEFVDAINPIKLFEYCSSGIPVVCSDMKEVKELKAPVYIAKDNVDFANGVNMYLDGINNDYRNKIIRFGRSNSWQKRFEYVKNILKL